MKKHTLIIHHLEETWREGLKKHGTSPEELSAQIIDFLHSKQGRHINEVIFTKWECPGYEEIPPLLVNYLDERKISHQVQVFGYGETREMYMHNPKATLIKSMRYEDDEDAIVYIEDWHKDLVNRGSVYLCGAFNGECVQDARDMLNHVRGNKYTALEDLIVGSGETYKLKCGDPSEKIHELNVLIQNMEEFVEENDDLDGAIETFKEKLKKYDNDEEAHLAFKIFQGEEFGYIYSDVEEIDEILQDFISNLSLEIKPQKRSHELSYSP